ncbi:valine--tRNA ligase [Patescibacteria group bacterium]
MDKRYQPENFEDKIYKLWEKSKALTPRRNKKKDPFSIIMPPPNANAPLHIGHAMFVTLEDIMIRFQRMQGKSTLLLPGADHAGILTQVVFERNLAKKGRNRFDLGRETFFKACLKFTLDNKKIMYDQIKKIGASCDWSREKFTLDKKISKQVFLSFINLYKQKIAYRGERLINWCPRCMTALSDLEVEHKEIKTKLWFIKYPLKTRSTITGEERYMIVATTRPETMLGDTAIAVNPKDKRYKKFIGQKISLPLTHKEIPVISDKSVDIEFGTGVVKVTPAHDPLDFKMGEKHNLPTISVIGFDNKMTSNAGKEFVGLKAATARREIAKKLNKKNLLIKQKAYIHTVGHCERCKTMVEPLISKQWFINVNKKVSVKSKKLQNSLGVKTASLREFGLLAVRKNLIKIKPKRFRKNYLNWMKGLHDWCISRQLWWGHQLPIWYCGLKGLSQLQKLMNPKLVKTIKKREEKVRKKRGCGHIIISMNKPKSCPKCKSNILFRDPDTFDTWFSSGQWAHNSLGYPDSQDFKYWYPTSVMETGYEILPIWVAKMIMLSLYTTGKEPFETVYLHGLVRDAFGQKMSKSKGNVINPLDVIEKYGADALRMALIVGASPGNDISVGEEKIKGYRNFTNKVWNIGRFIEINFKATSKQVPWFTNNLPGLTKEDKLLIKKLNKLVKNTSSNLQELKFSLAGNEVYQFVWHEFADKYVESAKERVRNKDIAVLSTLRHVYINCLKLLHPFMPFVTEAVWQQFPAWHKYPGGYEKYLISSLWPTI